ncbi:MAG: hypothetical protein ACI9LY_003646 [Arenicella sp.]|jgi:hypothetical protein
MIALSSPLLSSGANEVLLTVLQLMHVLILGCWLGAELVINSTYRYAILAVEIPFAERDRMLGQTMKVNQFVRYALALQLASGVCLASLLGYLPFNFAWGLLFGLAWILLIFLGHRWPVSRAGRIVKMIERDFRLIVIGVLLIISGLGVIAEAYLPFWLAVKLFLFAGVIACGLGMRIVLLRQGTVWQRMREHGPILSDDVVSRKIYFQAAIILMLLWTLVASITALSLFKPV